MPAPPPIPRTAPTRRRVLAGVMLAGLATATTLAKTCPPVSPPMDWIGGV